jgi:hypothetical protein
MSDSQQPEEKKKVYTKPQATEIRLVAEEAVLGLCKLNNGSKNICLPDVTCSPSHPRS